MEKKIPPLASKQLESLLTPLSDIRPHPENYKIHNQDQISTLRASLKAFGCTQPIKVNLEGFIVAGHGMYQLYLEDGYTHAPVLYEALDKQLSKAYLIADNETARKGVTDQDKLGSLLQDVSEISDFDIEATGFDLGELDSFLDFNGVGSEEEAEAEAEKAVKEYVNLENDSIQIFHAAAGDTLGCIDYYNYLIAYTQGQPIPKAPYPPHSLVFVDSGALAGVARDGPNFVSLETQEKIVRYAEEMGAHWVTMLDIPMIPQVLTPLNKTKEEAYQIHIRNAKAFKKIQTDVRKVYVIQGPDFADFKRCCEDMKQLVTESDVVAIGTLKTRANDVDTIEKITALVHLHFPNNDIHLFGVTTAETIAKCVKVGATSCDSALVGLRGRVGEIAEFNENQNGAYSTKNTPLTSYCNTEFPISLTGGIRLGMYTLGMFNVNLAVQLEIYKQKALYESN